MKASDIRELDRNEIEKEIRKARAELFKFRFQRDSEEMQRAGDIRQLRRHVARLKTVLRERELEEANRG